MSDQRTLDEVTALIKHARLQGVDPVRLINEAGLLHTPSRRRAAQREIINRLAVLLDGELSPYVLTQHAGQAEVNAANTHLGLQMLLHDILKELQ